MDLNHFPMKFEIFLERLSADTSLYLAVLYLFVFVSAGISIGEGYSKVYEKMMHGFQICSH